MQATLRLRPLRQADGDEIAVWFQDAATRQHMGGMLPLANWLAFVLNSPAQQVWLAEDGEQAIGIIQVEWETPARVWVSVLVHPTRRRRGYAKQIFRRISAALHQQGVREMCCEIANDNVASRQAALSQGFSEEREATPTPGFRAFIYRCSP